MKTEMGQESLTCKVFGKPIRQRVELKTFLERQIEFSTIYKEDPAVPPGKFIVERKGVPGKVYRVERHMYDTAGSLLKKSSFRIFIRLSTDYQKSPGGVFPDGSGIWAG